MINFHVLALLCVKPQSSAISNNVLATSIHSRCKTAHSVSHINTTHHLHNHTQQCVVPFALCVRSLYVQGKSTDHRKTHHVPAVVKLSRQYQTK